MMVLLVAWSVACGDDDAPSASEDAGPPAPSDAGNEPKKDAVVDTGMPDTGPAPREKLLLLDLPEKLSEAGLFEDMATETLAAGVRAYTPNFPYWSDGVTRKQWLLLPPDEKIDTSDMDNWSFPGRNRGLAGGDRDGERVETRMLHRYGSGVDDWLMGSYKWSGDEATLLLDGFEDADGHNDIPSETKCGDCHLGRTSRLLGVSAIQLEMTQLDDLGSDGLLTDAPGGPLAMPGDATERAALGYLHGNCGHCHNPTGEPYEQTGVEMEFWQLVGKLGSVDETVTYQTAIGVGALLKPGEKTIVPGVAADRRGDPEHDGARRRTADATARHRGGRYGRRGCHHRLDQRARRIRTGRRNLAPDGAAAVIAGTARPIDRSSSVDWPGSRREGRATRRWASAVAPYPILPGTEPGPIVGVQDGAVAIDHEARVEPTAAIGTPDGVVLLAPGTADEVDHHRQLGVRVQVALQPAGTLRPFLHLGGDRIGMVPAQVLGLLPRDEGVLLGMGFASVDPEEVHATLVLLITRFQNLEVKVRGLSRGGTGQQDQWPAIGQIGHIDRFHVLVHALEQRGLGTQALRLGVGHLANTPQCGERHDGR